MSENNYTEIRMDGVTYHSAAFAGSFHAKARLAHYSYCYLLKKGNLILEYEASGLRRMKISAGSVFTLSGLTPHSLISEGRKKVAVTELSHHHLPISSVNANESHCDVELTIGAVKNDAMAFSGAYTGPLLITEQSSGQLLTRIWQIHSLICDELASAENYSEIAVRNYSEAIVVNITRHIKQSHLPNPSLLRDLSNVRILRVMLEIGRDPGRDWSVAMMAGLANMSRTAFAVEFKRVIGTTPLRSVTHARLARAIYELDNFDHSIEQIAEACHYGSAAAFIRAFQREFGMTPARWRKSR